jgi:hypothetical protein
MVGVWADPRELASRKRLRVADFPVVACDGTSPEGTRSGRRRRTVSEADNPVASGRFGDGVGSARRGPPRRGVAAVRLVAVVRSDFAGGIRLSPSVVLPLAAVPPRPLLRPLARPRELIHCCYPRGLPPKPDRTPRRSATNERISRRDTVTPGWRAHRQAAPPVWKGSCNDRLVTLSPPESLTFWRIGPSRSRTGRCW